MSLPLDLRRRIVAAYERNEGTYFELSRRFGVSEATVHRLLRLQRERGHVELRTPGRIVQDELPKLVRLVNENPDATLDQLRDAWVARNRCELSRAIMARALRRAGIRRQPVSAARTSAPSRVRRATSEP